MIDSSSYLSIKLDSSILSEVFSNLEDEFIDVGLGLDVNGTQVELSGEEVRAYPPTCKQDIAGCLDLFLGDFDVELLDDYEAKEINRSVESMEWSFADTRGKFTIDPETIIQIMKKESPETLERFKKEYSCEGEELDGKIRDYLETIDSVTVNYLFVYNRSENVEQSSVDISFD